MEGVAENVEFRLLNQRKM